MLPETLDFHLERGYKLKCQSLTEKQTLKIWTADIDSLQQCQKTNVGLKDSLRDVWDWLNAQCLKHTSYLEFVFQNLLFFLGFVLGHPICLSPGDPPFRPEGLA